MIDRLILDKRIFVAKSSIHGYGVFTDSFIPKGTIIEECHHFPTEEKTRLDYIDYRFSFPRGSVTTTMPAGFGAIYNHSDDPNIKWTTDIERNLFVFETIKDIAAGSELYSSYGKAWWTSRNKKKKEN